MKYQSNKEDRGAVFVSVGELTGMSAPAGISALAVRRLAGVEGISVSPVLEAEADSGGISFRIYGTADAVVITPDGRAELIEFVTRQGRGGRVSDRALLLAYLLAASRGTDSVTVRTVRTDAGFTARTAPDVTESRSAPELKKRTEKLLSGQILKASCEIGRAEAVIPSLRKMKFPHTSLREGQKTLIDETYTAVKHGKRLFVQAPTGIGKTVSVLYGALRAVTEEGFRRIFWLTAKTSAAREAFAAAKKLAKCGSLARTVMLTAKDQICTARRPVGEFFCDTGSCPLAKAPATAMEDALRSLLERWRGYTPGVISQTAREHGVCPYDLSLELASVCDVVICDCNYAFSPSARLKPFFAGESRDGYVFLVDEAHNLPDRARSAFSALLRAGCTSALMPYLREDEPLYDACVRLEEELDALSPLCSDTTVRDEEGLVSGYYLSSDPPAKLGEAAASLARLCAGYIPLASHSSPEAAAAASALLRACTGWADAEAAFGREYRTYIYIDRGVLTAELFCLDPSARLGEYLSEASASVFFSGTLTPAEYFSDVLGGGGEGYGISLPSPFPRKNLFVGAVTSVGTTLEERDRSVKKLVAVIASVCAAKAGNYIVFFPSYKYLEAVSTAFTERYPKVRTAIQKPGMTASDREAFLRFFADDRGVLRVGFCVLGGSFSEGIDLPGNRLIGTVIVGTGIPGLSAERNIIREYYDVKSGCGYDYAYTFPGMNSVLQAAGRVIRQDADKGCVILVDRRYSEERYRRLMPPHWKDIRFYGGTAELREDLGNFWKA